MSELEIEIIARERPEPLSLDARVGMLVEAKTELELAKKAKARAIWDKREAAYGNPQAVAVAVRILDTSVSAARATLTRDEISYAAAQTSRPLFEREVLRNVLRDEDRAQQRDQERSG